MNYVWIIYGYLHVMEEDEDEVDLSSEVWSYGDKVKLLTHFNYSDVQVGNKWENGCYIVQNSEGDIQAFDGQFISFENPNKKELH